MRPSDLDSLEQRFGITLPAGYRALMQDAAARFDQDYVIDDPSRLSDLNRRWRQSPGWEPTWFAIGEGFEGDVYYIDTGSDPVPVYCRGADGASELWMPTLADLAALTRKRPERPRRP